MRVAYSGYGSLGVLLLLCAAPVVYAQQWPPYPPLQSAQNIYYGNYQSNTVPGYIYPRGYANYYVQYPNAPTYPQYNAPRVYQPLPPTGPTTYPVPMDTPPAMPIDVPVYEDQPRNQRKQRA